MWPLIEFIYLFCSGKPIFSGMSGIKSSVGSIEQKVKQILVLDATCAVAHFGGWVSVLMSQVSESR